MSVTIQDAINKTPAWIALRDHINAVAEAQRKEREAKENLYWSELSDEIERHPLHHPNFF